MSDVVAEAAAVLELLGTVVLPEDARIRFRLRDQVPVWRTLDVVGCAGEPVRLERDASEAPHVVITLSAEDLVALQTRRLHPTFAFRQGRIQIAGDLKLLARLRGALEAR